MGNFDRFEKLDMLGELNEKYIKEADKYLAEPLLADGEVIRLAPERRKLSWKPFVAAAACAAVLIGGTAALSKYLNSKPVTPPVLESSDSSDASGDSSDSNSDDFNIPIVIPDDEYLVKMMELYGANVNIDYVRDKLDITEMELPEDISEAFRTMNGSPVVVTGSDIVVSRIDEDGYPEIRTYDTESRYIKYHSRSDDPEIDKNTELNVFYADYNGIFFEVVTYRGTEVDKRELRKVEINPNTGGVNPGFSWYTIHTLKGDEIFDSRMVYAGNALYFSVKENINAPSFTQQIYRYSFSYYDDKIAEPVATGAGLCTFNGDIYYWYDESGLGNKLVLRSLSEDMPIDADKFDAEHLAIGGSGIYESDSAVINCVSEYPILSGGTMPQISAVPFGFGLVVGDDNNRAIYNASTGELLVFDEDDELRTNLNWIGYDNGVCAYTANPGEPVKLWFIAKKDVVPDRPDIRSIKSKYKIDVPMGYVEDNFDIARYELPETINGKYAYYKNFHVIDKERTIVMLYDNDNPKLFDFAVYNFTNGSCEMIYQPPADKYSASRLEFANSDYLVFSVFEINEVWGTTATMYIIDLASGDYTPTMIRSGSESAEPSYFSTNTVLLDKKLYFNIYNDRAIYCYDIETRQLEQVAVEKNYLRPNVYKGTIVYETTDENSNTVLKSIDGSIELVNEKGGFWICENDIYRLNNKQSPTGITTGKTLIIGGKHSLASSCSKYISFYGTSYYQDDFVYDIANNKMLIYNGSVDCDCWLSDGTGVAMLYHGGSGSNDYADEIYVFTGK